ncbi:B12-binding domain-containing protein [Aestuariivirga sp.]|uniref:cobalamin B12-binding domain-containing protein n=1 Tax=Aestuariivirga sp. TaxID=2650926 RepID=UPI003593FEBF
MVGDQDESDGQAFARIEPRQHAAQGPEVNFLPPLSINVDSPDERHTRLAGIVAGQVVPRLMALYSAVKQSAQTHVHAEPTRTAEILELAKLILGPDNEDAADYILSLKDGGVSLDRLHMELLEPTARHLGALWEDDKIDFVDVTLGVSKLQRLVHVFSGLDHVSPYDDKRKVLLAAAPGDQHSLGNTMLQKFLRASGWHVWTCATPRIEEAADIAALDSFAVVGFSLGSDIHLESLALAVKRVRELSLNRKVGIMVGGSAIARNPEWVEAVGADGTAADGPSAVILAKKLLVSSLV